jgi:hypothetical protein
LPKGANSQHAPRKMASDASMALRMSAVCVAPMNMPSS